MNTLLKLALILTFVLPGTTWAKPCGRGFIADNKVCHKDSGGYLPVPARKIAKPKAVNLKRLLEDPLGKAEPTAILYFQRHLYSPGCPGYSQVQGKKDAVLLTAEDSKTTFALVPWSEGCGDSK